MQPTGAHRMLLATSPYATVASCTRLLLVPFPSRTIPPSPCTIWNVWRRFPLVLLARHPPALHTLPSVLRVWIEHHFHHRFTVITLCFSWGLLLPIRTCHFPPEVAPASTAFLWCCSVLWRWWIQVGAEGPPATVFYSGCALHVPGCADGLLWE